MKKSELKLKDVIDINNGKRLGYIDDIEIDLQAGKIKSVIVPSHQFKVLSFFSKKQDLVIAWENIHKIGEDVILVNI